MRKTNSIIGGFFFFIIAGGLFATAAVFRSRDDGADFTFHAVWFALNIFLYFSYYFIIDPAARLVAANEVSPFVFDEAEGITIKSRTLHAMSMVLYVIYGIVMLVIPANGVYSGLAVLFGSQFITNMYFAILAATFVTTNNVAILVIGIVSTILSLVSVILFLTVPGGELFQSIVLGFIILVTTFVITRSKRSPSCFPN